MCSFPNAFAPTRTVSCVLFSCDELKLFFPRPWPFLPRNRFSVYVFSSMDDMSFSFSPFINKPPLTIKVKLPVKLSRSHNDVTRLRPVRTANSDSGVAPPAILSPAISAQILYYGLGERGRLTIHIRKSSPGSFRSST